MEEVWCELQVGCHSASELLMFDMPTVTRFANGSGNRPIESFLYYSIVLNWRQHSKDYIQHPVGYNWTDDLLLLLA